MALGRAKLGRGPDQTGASTFELLAAVALAVLLAGAAAPSVRQSVSGVQLRAASVQFSAALLRARVAAMTAGRTWSVAVASDAYTVGPLGEHGERETLPGGVRFIDANSGGEVHFAPNGTAENATFTLGIASASRRVIVNQRGKVVCE